MKKFKIGDRVITTKDFDKDTPAGLKGTVIGFENTQYGDITVEFDEKLRNGHNCFLKCKSGNGRWGHSDGLEFLQKCTQKIVITTDGTETLARLYEGKKVVLTATAKCSPDDTFNFDTGAKLAFERLMEKKRIADLTVKTLERISEACKKIQFPKFEMPKITFSVEIKPKYYNGKVVCIAKNLYAPYTLGKVYEFKDGRVADDRGEMLPIQKPIKALEEWNNDPIKRAKFIPFVE